MPDYQLNDSIGYLINRASRAIRQRFSALLDARGFDITGEQWAVLVHLWEQDGRPQHELAEILHKDKTTITRLINSLEERDLVVRITDEQDRRRKRVHLTPRARRIEPEVKALAAEVLDEAVAGLDAAEVATCKTVLRHIFARMGSPEG